MTIEGFAAIFPFLLLAYVLNGYYVLLHIPYHLGLLSDKEYSDIQTHNMDMEASLELALRYIGIIVVWPILLSLFVLAVWSGIKKDNRCWHTKKQGIPIDSNDQSE